MPDAENEALPEEPVSHDHVDGALMVSFGAVFPGREPLALEAFTEASRAFGRLLTAGTISSFKPFFFADGQLGDVAGFFVLEGRREELDALRREEWFQRLLLRAGATVQNVRVHTLIAGSEAGRLLNLYREVRSELGLV
ncbi:MAG: hypothetical protein HYU28_05720 [Actinobacteria bacterium]|nr:hypothetical protein [Actinomycetota bacterium]